MAEKFKQKISLKYKLLLIFIPVVLFVLLFILYALSINNSIDSSFDKVNKSFDNLTGVLVLNISVKNLSEVAEAYADSADPSWERKYDDLLVIFDDLLNEIIASENWTEGKAILSEFEKTADKLQGIETLAIGKIKTGDITGARNILNSEYSDGVSLAGNLLFSYIDKESEKVSSEITNNQDYLLIQEAFFIVFAVLFLLITLLIIIRIFDKMVLRPIEKLAGITKIIANGDMTSRAEVTSRDEIGSLAYNFNIMLDRLEFSHGLLNTTIGDLNRANEELKKVDKMKSDFITIAAHQLRTPLTGIKWSLTAIMNGDMGLVQDSQKEYLKGAIESNQRMIDTVSEILKVNEIQAGSVGGVQVPTNPTKLLNSVLFDIYPQATRKNITINLNINRNVPLKMNIDEGEMRIILQNLLENSIVYSKEKGKIDVFMRQEGEDIMISVRDYGIGIPAEERKNIFTKFFRATNAIKYFANGSGLGLVITKSVVEQHKGKIWFESEEGKGTTFYVSLPIER